MIDWDEVAARHDGALDEEPPTPEDQAEIDRRAQESVDVARAGEED